MANRAPQNGMQAKKRVKIRAKNHAKHGRQTVPGAHVTPPQTGPDLLSSSEAASLCGVSLRTFKRQVAAKQITPYSTTPGGHSRFRRRDIEAQREEMINPSHGSPLLAHKKEQLTTLQLTLEEKKTRMALQELEDQDRQRKEEQNAERLTEEHEARAAQLRSEGRRFDRKEQKAEARAARARQKWEEGWIMGAINSLPKDAPSELTFDVAQAVKQILQTFQGSGHIESLVAKAVQASVEKTLSPWKRDMQAARAADEAIKQLPILARSNSWAPMTEWEARAKEEALVEISHLPQTATFDQMAVRARAVVKRLAQEYQHTENLASWMREVQRSLSGLLPYSTIQEWGKVEEAMRTTFSGLPIGATGLEFAAARDAALAPFIAAESEARAAHRASEDKAIAEVKAKAAEEQLERDADSHLCRVYSYLDELEGRPDGWDFEGKKYEHAEQIKRDIRPDLINELPLEYLAGQQFVEELVDKWLANKTT